MFECDKCGSKETQDVLEGMHLKRKCNQCGKFITFVKQEHNKETGEIASDKQIKYAKDLLKQWFNKHDYLTLRQANEIIRVFKDVI